MERIMIGAVSGGIVLLVEFAVPELFYTMALPYAAGVMLWLVNWAYLHQPVELKGKRGTCQTSRLGAFAYHTHTACFLCFLVVTQAGMFYKSRGIVFPYGWELWQVIFTLSLMWALLVTSYKVTDGMWSKP